MLSTCCAVHELTSNHKPPHAWSDWSLTLVEEWLNHNRNHRCVCSHVSRKNSQWTRHGFPTQRTIRCVPFRTKDVASQRMPHALSPCRSIPGYRFAHSHEFGCCRTRCRAKISEGLPLPLQNPSRIVAPQRKHLSWTSHLVLRSNGQAHWFVKGRHTTLSGDICNCRSTGRDLKTLHRLGSLTSRYLSRVK